MSTDLTGTAAAADVAGGPQVTVWSDAAGEAGRPLVVLIHGAMDRSAGLLRLSRRLDADHRVVRYDRRGYGRSTGVGPPWTVAANIDDLREIVETELAAAPGPAVLVGHSFGGNVALGLAARRPDLVAAVAVYETPMSWLASWSGNSAGAAAMSAPDSDAAAEAFIRRLVGDAAWDRLSPAKQAQRRQEGAAMVAELADLRRRAPWSPAQLELPVLTMYGEFGRPHHREAMRRLSGELPDATCVEIPEAGHPGPHTHPDAVAAPLVAFISSLPSPHG
jgi:pimeloyl-ACP methyl ester carboxylesterase